MSAIFSWLMEGAKRFHYFDLDACAPQKLKRGSLANWNLLVDMIYRDISNHQLQSGGIFETPHVKPRSFVSQKDSISQSKTKVYSSICGSLNFCPFNGHMSKNAWTAQNVRTWNWFRLKPQLILWERDDRETYVWLWYFGMPLYPASENPVTQTRSIKKHHRHLTAGRKICTYLVEIKCHVLVDICGLFLKTRVSIASRGAPSQYQRNRLLSPFRTAKSHHASKVVAGWFERLGRVRGL